MLKTTENKYFQYKIAIIGAISSVLLTAVYDWIREKPILTTVQFILDWLYYQLLLREVPLWIVLGGIFAAFVSRKLQDEYFNKSPDFTNYNSDKIKAQIYKWSWRKNSFGKWQITDLRVLCEKCDTETFEIYAAGRFIGEVECPRCDHKMANISNKGKIETIILDNISRDNKKKVSG